MAAKKAPSRKAAGAKKTSGASAWGKKSPAKKTSVTEPGAAKKTGARTSAGRKYSPAASAAVATELHEMHEGKLRSGGDEKKVTDPKQAIAIGLSEARRAGKKVPPNPNRPISESDA